MAIRINGNKIMEFIEFMAKFGDDFPKVLSYLDDVPSLGTPIRFLIEKIAKANLDDEAFEAVNLALNAEKYGSRIIGGALGLSVAFTEIKEKVPEDASPLDVASAISDYFQESLGKKIDGLTEDLTVSFTTVSTMASGFLESHAAGYDSDDFLSPIEDNTEFQSDDLDFSSHDSISEDWQQEEQDLDQDYDTFDVDLFP